jgi:hypothetical protein
MKSCSASSVPMVMISILSALAFSASLKALRLLSGRPSVAITITWVFVWFTQMVVGHFYCFGHVG